MKSLPLGLQDHLDGGATTLAWCWRLTRQDGAQLGFTDHDRDVVFDGTTFEASAGFTASEIRDGLGLSVDNLEVTSALHSDRLGEADLQAGLFDDAHVEIFRVNWAAPEQRLLMRAGSLGEVRRSGLSFTAEIRGLAHYLQQPKGRLFQFTCDADLGDARCGVSLASAQLTGNGSILSADSARRFTVSGLAGYDDDWFTRGLLTITSGSAKDWRSEVREHRLLTGGSVLIELWQQPAEELSVGTSFSIRAGCDKQLTTCKAKFANTANFRGFPHMPGNDFVSGYAVRGRP